MNMASILVAEDEINIASSIERGLREFDHEVTVAHDGAAPAHRLGDETDHPVDEAPFISFAWRPGLSLSARILQTCGAHVTVRSALGKGTTVVIVFP